MIFKENVQIRNSVAWILLAVPETQKSARRDRLPLPNKINEMTQITRKHELNQLDQNYNEPGTRAKIMKFKYGYNYASYMMIILKPMRDQNFRKSAVSMSGALSRN